MGFIEDTLVILVTQVHLDLLLIVCEQWYFAPVPGDPSYQIKFVILLLPPLFFLAGVFLRRWLGIFCQEVISGL
jgi:hypothetical protein